MLLKICGLREPANIQEVVDLAPDYVGFLFYRYSERYIGDDRDIRLCVRSLTGTRKTGVFVNASFDEVLATVDDYELDVVQLHGNETPDLCNKLNEYLPVIKAFGIHDEFVFQRLEPYVPVCSSFLFDTSDKGYGGSGNKFDWSLLASYTLCKEFILSGGIGPEDISTIKDLVHPELTGIDINSRFEDRPGFKNIDMLKQLVREIRN